MQKGNMKGTLSGECVWVRQASRASYSVTSGEVHIYMGDTAPLTAASTLVGELFHDAGFDLSRYGTEEWNPLGDLIRPGDSVLLKPNWVSHQNHNRLTGNRLDCLVTHTSVIEAVLYYVAKAQPGRIIIGDAPIQGCDFNELCRMCEVDSMLSRFKGMGCEITLRDFRLTKMKGKFGQKQITAPDSEHYCLFDLGDRSWLAPITNDRRAFRVTMYDPNLLQEHHCPGKHQYLVARDVIDADVVINLPKLKTHRMAGVTGALKNMVGINGFKEYLPHHRKGGSAYGGDCYEGGSPLKSRAENCLDRANISKHPVSRFIWSHLAGIAFRTDTIVLGNDTIFNGGWYGNDTVWRMCLDLQRILHYGQDDGQLSQTMQRKVITITDAIIGGDGDGPLAPNPVPLGVITLGENVAALDFVHCLLMHLDPDRIPLVANAFARGPWPLAEFDPIDIKVCFNGEPLEDARSVAAFGRAFSPPIGWKGHCELNREAKI